jgi:hypothetical protein
MRFITPEGMTKNWSEALCAHHAWGFLHLHIGDWCC